MKFLQDATKTRHLKTMEYRKWYKEQVPKSYRPLLHIFFNFGLLLALMVYHFVGIESWNLYVLLFLCVIFILGNFTVWVIHKYPLHKRFKFWTYPFVAHTVQHHRYFTSESITYDGLVDYHAIFFPMRVIAGFATIAQPLIYFGTRYLWGESIAHALSGAAAGYFLLYEVFHWASHLGKDHPVMAMPWFRYMREHHRAHHNPALMSRYNFCIVDPLADILLGTKYSGEMPADEIEDHFKNVQENA